MRKDLSFLGFWVPTCPNQHGRTLKCRSTVAASAPTKMDTSTSSNVNLLKLSTSELTNSWSFMYYKMDFISFIDSWNISSPWIIICYKMIIGFFRVKFLALQNEDWFLSSKNQSKKHLLQNDKPGVCNKMHFTSPFFFYQFRVRWHSVVSISSPFL